MTQKIDYKVALGITYSYFFQYDKFQNKLENIKEHTKEFIPVFTTIKTNIRSFEVMNKVLNENDEALKSVVINKFQNGEKFVSSIEEIISIKDANSINFFIAEQCRSYVFNNQLLFAFLGAPCISALNTIPEFIIDFVGKKISFLNDNAEIIDVLSRISGGDIGALLDDTSVVGNTTNAVNFDDSL